VLERGEKGHVVLVVKNNDRKRRPQKFQGAGTRFRVQFLATDTQQEPLQQAIGQQDEDDLVDDQGKSAGAERFQVAKALQLSMPFFHRWTQAIFLAGTAGIPNRGRINQDPVLHMPIGINLPIDQGIERDGTGGKGLQPVDRSHLGANSLEGKRFGIWGGGWGSALRQGSLAGLLPLSDPLGSVDGNGRRTGNRGDPGLEG